ncbi:MAG: hypothetical protein AAF914_04925 [Pseudomonadota bacterium]
MTPTLLGRIQTRLILFFFIGLPITFIFALGQAGWRFDWSEMRVFFVFLICILVVGLILDPVYILIQRFRWDRDWPFAFQFLFSIVEFLIVLGIAAIGFLPFLDAMTTVEKGANVPPGFNALTPTIHFILVFIPSFLALLGPISLFAIRWRFKAGQLGKM